MIIVGIFLILAELFLHYITPLTFKLDDLTLIGVTGTIFLLAGAIKERN